MQLHRPLGQPWEPALREDPLAEAHVPRDRVRVRARARVRVGVRVRVRAWV